MKLRLALIVLALSSLSCLMSAAHIETPPAQPSPTASPTRTPVPTAEATVTANEVVRQITIRAIVWVRAEPDGERIGSLETGQEVELVGCDGSWCEVRTDELDGFVFRGCTDNNPDGLDCEAAP
jgi:hypothetical protein